MLGIEKEAAIFLYACLSGTELYLVYQVICYFRSLVRHSMWVINFEDIIYWLFVSIYLFRQMYRTTYGEIRWFFVLGVISGVLTAHRFKRSFCHFKNHKKSHEPVLEGEIKPKSKKYLEKRNETR